MEEHPQSVVKKSAPQEDASPMATEDLGSPSCSTSLPRENDNVESDEEGFRLGTIFGELPILPMDVEGLLMEREKTKSLDGKQLSDNKGNKVRELRRLRKDLKAEEAARPKPPKITPNAFVAVRIRSSAVREKLEHVQQEMVNADRRMNRLVVSLDKLHITLMVTRLDTQEQIATYVMHMS